MIDPDDFTPEALRKIAPACGTCPDGGNVDIATGEIVYPHRPDLWAHGDGARVYWWLCSSCWGYVGMHRETLKPLGSPADKETRHARSAAHAAFDPMWRKRQRLSGVSKQTARGRGYKWLAEQLGIDRKDCHIGIMDAATARRVVEVCKAAMRKGSDPTG